MVYQEEEKPKKTDGLEDLFRVDREDILDTDDVVAVDMEKDIIDGDLEDVTTVTNEDVMGNIYGQSPLDGANAQRKKKELRERPVTYPYYPPTQIGGVR